MTLRAKIRILLADDHPVVREGIRACLAAYEQIEVVGEAVDGPQTLALAAELHPDIVVMDLNMPELNGLEATRRLRNICPETHVLVLTVHNKQEYVHEAIRSGARGYLLKESPPQELIRAIEVIQEGETFFSGPITQHVLNDYVDRVGQRRLDDLDDLTEREREVLALIADGFGNKDIALRLGIAIRTVESHRIRIMEKLNIRTIAGLTKFAISRGLVLLP